MTDTPSGTHPVASGLRDGVALGASRLVQAVLAVAAQKALLRVTSEEDLGRFYTFIFVANLLVACLAWPAASVLRLGAEEWVARRKLGATAVLHLLLVLGSFLLVAVLAIEAREPLDRYVLVHDATLLLLAYALLTALGAVLQALLKPPGRIGALASLATVSRVSWAIVLGGYAFTHRLLDARVVIVICTGTALLPFLVGLALTAREALPPRKPDPRDAERALRFGLPVMARNLGTQSFANAPLAAVRHFHGLVEVGRFQIGASLVEQTAQLATLFEDLMGPILARAAAKGEGDTLGRYYRTLAPQVVLAWSAACGATLILARPVLAALSAKAVDASAGPFQVLFLATAVRMIVSLEAPVFDAHLISKAPLAFFGVGFATILGLNAVLVPAWGIDGAAWAALAGWFVNCLLRSVYLGRSFRVPSLRLYLGLAPVAVAFAYARTLGGPSPLQDALCALGVVVLTIVFGKVAGVFKPETLAAVEGVNMPARLRAFLTWFYGASK